MSILTPPPSTALVPLVFVFCSLLATSGHCQSLLHSKHSQLQLPAKKHSGEKQKSKKRKKATTKKQKTLNTFGDIKYHT